MFTPDPTWAGPLVAAAAVALRIYLKGNTMPNPPETHPHLRKIRDGVWDLRQEYLDFLLLHGCDGHEWAVAMLWLVGWDPETFIDAALRNRREVLDA